MTTQTQQAAAQQSERSSARGLVATYAESFASVLPSHVKPSAWVRLTQGALKQGKRVAGGRTQLEQAAENDPGAFLSTLLDAARLGLEPGTEEFYLIPRRIKGRDVVTGIVGYQGLIELIYRAGAVSSVIAETVHENDSFSYRPGRDEVPDHDIDWTAPSRGKITLVYAYARMKDGAVSRVVVLNASDIARIRSYSMGADSETSPWKTSEVSMWLKSAIRQLAKWVPTSAECLNHQARAEAERASEVPLPGGEAYEPRPAMDIVDAEVIDPETGEIHEATA